MLEVPSVVLFWPQLVRVILLHVLEKLVIISESPVTQRTASLVGRAMQDVVLERSAELLAASVLLTFEMRRELGQPVSFVGNLSWYRWICSTRGTIKVGDFYYGIIL